MDVSSTVSEVARQQAVRTVLVERQRQIALEHPRLVTEGRDQGSVVFPDAAVRFFLHADPVVRARRRVEQLAAKGQDVDLDAVTADIEQRDRIDSTRSDGPLIRPEGAIDLDTSEMSIDQVVEAMVEAVESVMGPGESD
jgi:cytidylate kinase